MAGERTIAKSGWREEWIKQEKEDGGGKCHKGKERRSNGYIHIKSKNRSRDKKRGMTRKRKGGMKEREMEKIVGNRETKRKLLRQLKKVTPKGGKKNKKKAGKGKERQRRRKRQRRRRNRRRKRRRRRKKRKQRRRRRRSNLYRDGNDSVAWHGDRHRHHTTDPVVVLLSLGAPRPLKLRRRGGGPSRSWDLGGGDLFAMGGACQHDWEHCVPKLARAVGPRMSVAFRHDTR